MSKSPLRILLSILIIIISVVRLATKCSHSQQMEYNQNTFNSPEENQYDQNTLNAIEAYQNNPNILNSTDENQLIQQEIYNSKNEKISNGFLYDHFENLNQILPESMRAYGILELKKDTLVYLDLYTKFKFLKDSYLQNNHDDSLHYAVKKDKNMLIFVHDFDSTEDAEENFKQLKRSYNPSNIIMHNDLKNVSYLTYTIQPKKKPFHGFAISFHQENYQLFIEFESDSLSIPEIQKFALNYLKTNLSTTNKS